MLSAHSRKSDKCFLAASCGVRVAAMKVMLTWRSRCRNRRGPVRLGVGSASDAFLIEEIRGYAPLEASSQKLFNSP